MLESRPIRSTDWAAPAFFSGLAWVLFTNYDGAAVWGWGLLILAVVLAVVAVVNYWDHRAEARARRMESREASTFRLSENYLADTVARMNRDQLVALREYGVAVIEIEPTDRGPVEIIRGIPVFLNFAWDYLENSTSTHCAKISNYFANTYHFDELRNHAVDDASQARAFTAWLIRRGWASSSYQKNRPAIWVDEFARDKVARSLGIELETSKGAQRTH